MKFFNNARYDFTFGGTGDFRFNLGRDNDVIFGRSGNDNLNGGRGNDWIFAGEGDDMVFAGAGNDIVFGGSGKDTIEGGKGNDLLTGGTGADRFLFNPARQGEGHDRITDFSLGEDKIVLNVADVLASSPGLLALSGKSNEFEPTDLDASPQWNLGASKDGDLVVYHPNGTIELDGVKFSEELTFNDILPAIELVG